MGLRGSKLFHLSLILLLLLVFPSCHIIRAVFWNNADINDYKKFPNDPVRTAPPSHYFSEPASKMSGVFRPKLIPGCDTCGFDHFIFSHETVAFLIIRNDSIIYEKYRQGYSQSSILPSFSVAKSFVSALTGIAVAEGYIKSIRQPVTDWLPEMRGHGFDRVTLEDLLEMRSGIDFNEGYNSLFGATTKFYYGLNLKKYCEKLKVVSEPGTIYNYQSANTQILAMVLEKATGQKLADYFEAKIWKPLGMQFDASWSIDSKKHQEAKAFCCINARAVDFAKFGELYLHYGRWNDREVITPEWIRESLTIRNDSKDSRGYPYTYFWRVMNDGDFFAYGVMGQYVYVCPEENIVIVRFGKKAGGVPWPEFFHSLARKL
jgi:CubicO group peptidase (beta-lactamase class C family)